MGHLTVYTGNIAGNLTKIFQKSQMPRGLPGGGGAWAVLELTGTLALLAAVPCLFVTQFCPSILGARGRTISMILIRKAL